VTARRRQIVIGLAALAVAALAPLPFNNLVIANVSAVTVLYAFGILSVVILTGYVGQVSLCQATFMGISAFTVGALVNSGVNYFAAAVVGVLAAFVLGVLVGIPALRLRGILLAIVTVGVALSFDYYFYQDQVFAWFNGGLSGWHIGATNMLGVELNNFDPPNMLHVYWLLLVVFAIVAVLIYNIHDSGSGRRFRAIRESEIAAATMGVNLTQYKLLAFGLAAAVAGVGGAFFPLVEGTVTNQPFSFFVSLQFAAIAVLVGIRFIPAAFLGGVFMSAFPEALKHAQDVVHVEIPFVWFNVALGLLLIVQMIQFPDGIYGHNARLVEHLAQRFAKPKALATEVQRP
jgi:ABC-type branched-subunit amino acid transport system permease subunit